jgi:hypothetical protein
MPRASAFHDARMDQWEHFNRIKILQGKLQNIKGGKVRRTPTVVQ